LHGPRVSEETVSAKKMSGLLTETQKGLL